MTKVLTITNEKGGVGKTTTSVNLGGALADLGLRVLFIDTDTQQSTSRFLSVDPRPSKGLVEFVQHADKGAITPTRMSDSLKGKIDIIVNNDPNNGLRLFLSEAITHSFNLAHSIKEIEDDYDVILIDTKSSDGNAEIKAASVLAADILLCPTRPAGLDAAEIEGNVRFFEKTAKPFKSMGLTRNEPVMKILINAADRTNLSKEISKHLREQYSDGHTQVSVLANEVPNLEVYASYFTEGNFVHRLDTRKRPGKNPSPSAAATMLSLVHELFPN